MFAEPISELPTVSRANRRKTAECGRRGAVDNARPTRLPNRRDSSSEVNILASISWLPQRVRAEFENGMLRVTIPDLTNRHELPINGTSTQRNGAEPVHNQEKLNHQHNEVAS